MSRVEFYEGNPPSADRMWCQEQQSIAPFCQGRGLDPGAGRRTLYDSTIRADLFREYAPHVVANATALPFQDASFDYVANSHLLEHLESPRDAIREWLRVVKPGGVVAMIVPDPRWTGCLNTDATPHRWEKSPAEFQADVLGWEPAARWWERTGPVEWADAEVVHMSFACAQWSFCVVLRKGGACAS